MFKHIASFGIGRLAAKFAVTVLLLGALGLVLGWWQWPSTSDQAAADVSSPNVAVVAGAQVGEACESSLDISIAPDESALICSDRDENGSVLASRVWREAADQLSQDADLDRFLEELESELADNSAYVLFKEQAGDLGFDEQAGIGFSYVGESYCEEYRESGAEGVLRQMGYNLEHSKYYVALIDQIEELGGPPGGVVPVDFVEMYVTAFVEADRWLCPSLGMLAATDRIGEDETLDLMAQGSIRFAAEQQYTDDIEFMLQPDPAVGWYGVDVMLSSQQWIELGWLACDQLDQQDQRSFFEVTQTVGARSLDLDPSAGLDTPRVASWVLGNAIEYLCPDYLSSYRAWDEAPDGPFAVLLGAALTGALDTLEASTGVPLGEESVSYDTVRSLYPILESIGSFTLFTDYALVLDVESPLDAVGSAYELVWAKGLMPTDTAMTDLADGAAALTVAIATQNSPRLLAILVDGT